MNEAIPGAGWRIKLAGLMLVASFGWIVVLPVLPLLGFSATAIATFTGVMAVVAEVLMVAGAAIAGKDGFAYIKSRVFGFLKSYGPPQTVGRTRYRIGLVMFVLPVLSGWVWPYAAYFFEGLSAYALTLGVAGDLVLLASLFVLGGDFWDKLGSLFSHNARVIVPGKGSEDAS